MVSHTHRYILLLFTFGAVYPAGHSNSKLPQISGETENEQQISVTRYDTFKNLIEVVLTEREELDENLGVHAAKNLTIPFKIAFNTLLINKIIKTL